MDPPPMGTRKDRAEGKEFMDAARGAFIRYVALSKWREMEDMRETLGHDWAQAAQEAARFPDRGPYQGFWTRQWEEYVLPAVADPDPGRVFAAVEHALATALRAEETERKSRGDRPLEEDPAYKGFLDWALESLFREQAGELERFDYAG